MRYRCEVYIQSRSTGLIDMQTWAKDKNGYADWIGYTGQDERLLMETSSGGLEEDIDHTLGDSLKLLENIAAILNTYRSKYLDSNKTTFSRLKVFGIQCIKTTITLISVSAPGDGKFLYHTPRTSQIPTTFDERHHLLSLFELLAYLLVRITIKVVCWHTKISLILYHTIGYLSRTRWNNKATPKRTHRLCRGTRGQPFEECWFIRMIIITR